MQCSHFLTTYNHLQLVPQSTEQVGPSAGLTVPKGKTITRSNSLEFTCQLQYCNNSAHCKEITPILIWFWERRDCLYVIFIYDGYKCTAKYSFAVETILFQTSLELNP